MPRAKRGNKRLERRKKILKLANIELDRKVLADLAVHQPESFASVAEQAKNALDSEQRNQAA